MITKFKIFEKNLFAPNGKPSNLNSIQYKLVRTKAFKKWFGDWENTPEKSSKVIDENGEPLVVWHSSNKEFNIFKVPAHFGTKYAAIDRSKLLKFEKLNIIYYECFLNIRNPYITHDWMTKYGWNAAKDLSLKNNNDGIKYINSVEDKSSISWIIFEETQIKLADGTNTTFDKNNQDIRK